MIKFTPCQAQAMKEIPNWYHNSQLTSWTLIGAAGTGKSFLVNELKKAINVINVAITAPTHKALRVSEKFTNIRGQTIHKLLGLRPNYNLEDFDIRNPQFAPSVEPSIGLFNLVIVDECSMINDGLFELLVRYANRSNTRLLFVGDVYQLPPVSKNKVSLASKTFTDTGGQTTLLTPARQSVDNPLYLLLCAARCDIYKDSRDLSVLTSVSENFDNPIIQDIIKNNPPGSLLGNFIKTLKDCTNDANEGYEVINDKFEFTQMAVDSFNTEAFTTDPNFCRLIGYRNNTIRSWNKFIRDSIMESNRQLVAGDLLMSYNTIYEHGVRPLIVDSSEYRVKEVLKSDSLDMTVNDKGSLKTFKVPVSYVMIENIFDKDVEDIAIRVLDPEFPSSMFNYDSAVMVEDNPYYNFIRAHEINHSIAVNGGSWPNYYNWKNSLLLTGDIPPVIDHRTPKKDLDYAYAITCHKAQGSTFDYSFVNMSDILSHSEIMRYLLKTKKITDITVEQIDQITLKLAYVALSRASKHCTIFYKI